MECKFCPNCGANVIGKFCVKCGTAIPDLENAENDLPETNASETVSNQTHVKETVKPDPIEEVKEAFSEKGADLPKYSPSPSATVANTIGGFAIIAFVAAVFMPFADQKLTENSFSLFDIDWWYILINFFVPVVLGIIPLVGEILSGISMMILPFIYWENTVGGNIITRAAYDRGFAFTFMIICGAVTLLAAIYTTSEEIRFKRK